MQTGGRKDILKVHSDLLRSLLVEIHTWTSIGKPLSTKTLTIPGYTQSEIVFHLTHLFQKAYILAYVEIDTDLTGFLVITSLTKAGLAYLKSLREDRKD